MKRTYILILYILLLPGSVLSDTTDSGAKQIIERSDAIKNPGQSFEMILQIVEYKSGSPRNEVKLAVFSKPDVKTGQYRNLVRYAEPPRDAGKTILMNGTKMWFYDPASKTSVLLSPQARLLGQASNGDVVTVNFAVDYSAKLTGAGAGEILDDADRKQKKCWHLELLPVISDAVYGRIEYWVEKDTYRPVKGKFYSDSGRLLKIAYYHKFENQLGNTRPTEIIIIDGVDSKLVTTMNYSGYMAKNIPDSWFQRDYLPRIK